MKPLVIAIVLGIQLNAYAQIHTNPGGGPNPYGEIQHPCSNLDPVVFVFERVLVEDLKKRDKRISSNDLLSILEQQSLMDSLAVLQSSSKLGKPSLICTSDEKESLITIKEMYLEASFNDKECQYFLKVNNILQILERAIQSNGKN
jgi:hypothetical protein